MKTLDQATSRELEMQQLRLAIVRADVKISHMENALDAMRQKQTARHREVAIQETLARCSNDKSSEPGTKT